MTAPEVVALLCLIFVLLVVVLETVEKWRQR
jgi:hypothetical protein